MEFVGLNSQLPPLDDVRVRQAMGLAVDRSALEAVSGPGFLSPAGILPPGMPGYTPEVKVLPYDPERARRLLAEAGYGPKRPVRLDFYITARSREGMTRDSVLRRWAQESVSSPFPRW
jgi:ABC-type transport system substrate-binding protein